MSAARHKAHGEGEDLQLSVVMPCLNEGASVGRCVDRAWEGMERAGLRGEVVVCDNGSSDDSVVVAEKAGARVVHQPRRGYGLAYLTAMRNSVGGMILMGDSDSSYDFLEIERLVEPLREGYDYVLGSRFAGEILPGAMPGLHRYVGNPVLTGVLNVLFGLHTTDAHSGMRAFTRDAYERMDLRSEGMELASEIVIAAARAGLRMTEVPITYHRRLGDSKLHPWRDGARHLRFMGSQALAERTGRSSRLRLGPTSTFAPEAPAAAVSNGNGHRPAAEAAPQPAEPGDRPAGERQPGGSSR